MPWEAQAAGSWIGPLSSFPGQAPVFSPPRRAGCPKAWSRQAVLWPKLPLAPASLSPHRGRVTERCSPGTGHPVPWFPRKTRQRCHLLTGSREEETVIRAECLQQGAAAVSVLALLGLVASLPPHPGKTVGTELGWNLFPSRSFCSDPGQSRAQEVG